MPSDEIKGEKIIWEKTILIYSFIDPDLFEMNINALKDFLHRFGRETNQGEVVFEFDGQLFKISKYNE